MKSAYIVHDLEESQSSSGVLLETLGFHVTYMTSVQECLNRLRGEHPTVIVMDVLLDGPNGFEACRQIREEHGPEQFPIILRAGIFRSSMYREEALRAGAQHYLVSTGGSDLSEALQELAGSETVESPPA